MKKRLLNAGLLMLGALPFVLGLAAGVLCGAAVWIATSARVGWRDGFEPWRGENRGAADSDR
jgi:hypothetical protein